MITLDPLLAALITRPMSAAAAAIVADIRARAEHEVRVAVPRQVSQEMQHIGPSRQIELENAGELRSYLDGSRRLVTTASTGLGRGALTPCSDALVYAQFGLRVAPSRANGLLLVNPERATRNPRVIMQLWARWPFADIAWPLPPSAIAVVIDNRFRHLEQFDGRDAQSVETPTIATATGGACLLFAASVGPCRARIAVDDERIEVLAAGAHVLLPSAGTGRQWLRPLSETPLAPIPSWIEHEAIEPPADGLFQWARQAPAAKAVAAYSSLKVPASDIASALGRRKRSARGNYLVRCPGPNHRNGDLHPSLSIGNGPDGRLLIHCFGNCAYADIVAALERRGILVRKGGRS